jgi:sugar phosphate isomerase/epimerase
MAFTRSSMPLISLFSQSFFALSLMEAIPAVVRSGYDAVELACVAPHFDIDTARRDLHLLRNYLSADTTTGK